MSYQNLIFVKYIKLTIWLMKMFVSVRNWVTISAILPGIAERGIMKLKLEAITIVIQGM